MFKKTIISEFFTTVSFNQALQSLYLMTFWSYKLKYWKDKELFEKELLEKVIGWTQGSPLPDNVGVIPCVHPEKYSKIISFYNWRSAIFHALKIIWVNNEDEVIINAYNCVSVSNSVIQTGAKVIYSDIELDSLSFDFEILKSNITESTKVIIIQHTFWKKAGDYDKIIDFCKKENILVIEDCAHSLGNNNEIKWDFAIFSTGRDKVISSITGWFLIINNENYVKKVENADLHYLQESLKMPSVKLVFQNLMYNVVWYKSYKLYDFFKLWRVVIFLSRKLNLITEILTPNEKACNFNNFYLKFPNSLAYLARKELKMLNKYIDIRLDNSKYYLKSINNKKIEILFNNFNNYNWFRFSILLKSEEEKNNLIKLWRKNNIIFWNQWSWSNIIPIWTDLEKAQYKIWSCPVSEDISKRILILPNHKLITKKDIDRVIEVLNNFK